MKKVYEITGKSKIKGIIKVQGSKNSALAIIVASLLCKDIVFLENVPRIKDVFELLEILKKINVNVSFIDNNKSTNLDLVNRKIAKAFNQIFNAIVNFVKPCAHF